MPKLQTFWRKKMRAVIVFQNHYLNQILDVHPLCQREVPQESVKTSLGQFFPDDSSGFSTVCPTVHSLHTEHGTLHTSNCTLYTTQSTLNVKSTILHSSHLLKLLYTFLHRNVKVHCSGMKCLFMLTANWNQHTVHCTRPGTWPRGRMFCPEARPSSKFWRGQWGLSLCTASETAPSGQGENNIFNRPGVAGTVLQTPYSIIQ